MRSARLFPLLLSLAACASVRSHATDPTANAQFERLKSLSGEWVVLAQDSDAPAGALVRYRVTSAGSAVVETLFADSPHEMVTVYTLDAGRLALTHYCTLANQPRMIAAPSQAPERIRFAFDGGANVDSEAGNYMGAAEFVFLDDAHVQARWTMFKGAQAVESVRFSLVRSWR
ncbi:MAG: hypothetical protein IT454_20505 [Planctomycetes bacterium]|nr:hypothetical protein [Planctomycetota bacterium]